MVIEIIKKIVPLKVKLFFRAILLQTLGLTEEDLVELGGSSIISQGIEQKIVESHQNNGHKINALEKKMHEIDRYYFQVLVQKVEGDFAVLHEEVRKLRALNPQKSEWKN